ncbi:Type I phosphodiesterase / nucleotide pyrophosphatase [Nakaseomyces glabratus]|nr:major facilitator super transporter protein [Nakaseomyces glabratus]
MLFLLVVAHAIAVLIFGCGFFPQKKVLDGHAALDGTHARDPVFDKLVVVVVDAMRSDFLFDASISKFHFIHEKLADGSAWGFTAHSNPPTVTLPRLKGITTGSTPNFLDAILNVAEDDTSSSLLAQDSWLWQFRNNAGKRIRFFGDDTWLKLFPPVEANEDSQTMFDEYEGTNSFFVSDFTQVDLNVTRHIDRQLRETSEWDVLILHYLGLDHIGHKDGPYSRFMGPKHEEMDSIIRKLYDELDMQSTLLVLMGDHGMNDLGNHGGSSAGETSAGMVFLSDKLAAYKPSKEQSSAKEFPMKIPSLNAGEEKTFHYLKKIQQIDVVPTISSLFNVAIPKNNVGVIIPEFLQLFKDVSLQKAIVKENWNQLSGLTKGKTQIMEETKNFVIEDVIKNMKDVQENLAKTATDYNYPLLFIGCFLSIVITCTIYYRYARHVAININTSILIAIAALMGISVFGSSFIEEEHQFWWWIITGLVLLSMVNLNFSSWKSHIIVLFCLRLIRGWNNSGQKYTYDNVIANLLKGNIDALWWLNLITVTVVGLNLKSLRFGNHTVSLLGFSDLLSMGLLSMITFLYKVNWSIVNGERVPDLFYKWVLETASLIVEDATLYREEDLIHTALIPLARIFFKLFFAVLVSRLMIQKFFQVSDISKSLAVVSRYVTIFLVFQTPSHNIGLFLFFEIINEITVHIIRERYQSDYLLAVIFGIILQFFTFFQSGGTNSIATVDLSNAYNGVSENYNIYIVGLMMCISNFAPTIYWSFYNWRITYANANSSRWQTLVAAKYPFIIIQSTIGCGLLLACIILRYHLFIWSVFSPKLCYYMVWTIFVGIIVHWIPEILLLLT